MKVRDFIKDLKKYSERDIVFSCDEEGNHILTHYGFFELSDGTLVLYPIGDEINES